MTKQTTTTLEPTSDARALSTGPSAGTAVSCSAYGVTIALQTTADLIEYLPTPLTPHGVEADWGARPAVVFKFCSMRSSTGLLLYVVAENGKAVFAAADVREAVQVLESRMHLQVAARSENYVFVHAGVVAWEGRALMLPGASHSGKSTLVAALVAAGATYYSDEYAAIDREGLVHPFRRQLRLRPDVAGQSNAITAPRPMNPDTLDPLRPGWVLRLRYREGAAWAPEALTPGQTLLAMLENTVAVRRQSELTLRTLKLAVEPAIGWQSERGDTALAAADVLRTITGNFEFNATATRPVQTRR
jgi:hypothetical protein